MKCNTRIFVWTAIVLLMLILGIYFLLAMYYRNKFYLNTWINGVYCTGKTIEEVNSELVSTIEAPNIWISDIDGNTYQLSLEEIGYTGDYIEPLKEFMSLQKPCLWVGNLFQSYKHSMHPRVSYNQDAFLEYWYDLPFVKNELSKENKISITLSEKGYCLKDGMSNRLNMERAIQLVEESFKKGRTTIDLMKVHAYENIPLNYEQKEIMELWQQIESYQNCKIVYDMGDVQIPVDASVASGFITLKEDGSFALDEHGGLIVNQKGIESFINKLAEEYNTCGREREFHASRGETIVVKGGIYGTEIDIKSEVEYLTRAFLERKEEVHIPIYKKEALVRGKDDIGNTYIEIDMSEQKMYYYQEGECLVETDIVTGNTSRRMGTPEGVNYVYNKQKDRVLRGATYASPVKFWIPVNGNIGIHDASWRSNFGGEIYKKSGSHGCINTPYDQVKQLYELVEIGTPVIMFY